MLSRLINVLYIVVLITLTACSAVVIKKTGYSQMQDIPDMARAQFTRAVWTAKAGHYDEAIALFSELSKAYPLLARSYTNLGMLHLRQREFTSAEQALLHAVSVYPYDAIAQNHLGVVLRELGKFKQAEQAYLLAIKYHDEYSEAVLNLGVLYDLYLHDRVKALLYYTQYQILLDKPDALVAKWIVDVQRRIKAVNNKQLSSLQK